MKASPFCLHLFFAIGVVQGVEIQLVAVKVNAGFAFTLNRLIYSLLRGKVKGEGKNGKFAESAGAYIRVGACPARRMEWDFVRGGEVLGETREEVAKSGEVLRESRLVFFEWSGGGGEETLSFLFSTSAKVEIGANSKQKDPVKLLLSAKPQNDTFSLSATPINRRCGFLFRKVSPPFRQSFIGCPLKRENERHEMWPNVYFKPLRVLEYG